MLSAILSFASPIVLWFIKQFIKNAEAKQKAIKSYYNFLAQIDKKSATKVANYIAAENDLTRLQNQIREEKLIEPEREAAKETETTPYEIPEIEVIETTTKVKTHGKYLTDTGKAKGLVVHFTAGRYAKGRQSAINTLNYLTSKGLGCMVMDTDGKIYRAKSQDMDEIAWHAGKSGWLGATGISRYCMGMEICNAGKLDKKAGQFITWFQETVLESDVREVEKKDNVKAGFYHKYTPQQEKALLNFILWQLDTNSAFDLSWVVGHDEVAPSRKNDPGGSLSMTMPAFRSMIKEKLRG